ncbi:MAG: ABC transporter ATP-binding protein [Dehalococcoidia bacterium]|nr:ABC transporter ATP-binding protein [Dehalococcoidia bacterium]
MSLIELHDISKTYRSDGTEVRALSEIDLSIDEGELVALMGPSGSGKSTLLTILGAMNPPTTGKMLIDDINVYRLSVEQRADFRHEYLGFVFQQLQLIPYLTAIENVMLPLAISKRSNKEQHLMATTALERVGLGDKLRRLPGQLSGGEQERVAIARAIVNHPPLILADEPTGSLDTHTGEEIMQIFRDLNEEGLTILIVTHNPENTRYTQRTINIRDGHIVTQGSNPCA